MDRSGPSDPAKPHAGPPTREWPRAWTPLSLMWTWRRRGAGRVDGVGLLAGVARHRTWVRRGGCTTTDTGRRRPTCTQGQGLDVSGPADVRARVAQGLR